MKAVVALIEDLEDNDEADGWEIEPSDEMLPFLIHWMKNNRADYLPLAMLTHQEHREARAKTSGGPRIGDAVAFCIHSNTPTLHWHYDMDGDIRLEPMWGGEEVKLHWYAICDSCELLSSNVKYDNSMVYLVEAGRVIPESATEVDEEFLENMDDIEPLGSENLN
jgi:hypothetical protein